MFCCQRFYSLYPCESSSRFVLRISRRANREMCFLDLVMWRESHTLKLLAFNTNECLFEFWISYSGLLLGNRLTCFTFSPTLSCVSSVVGSTEALMSGASLLTNLYLQLTYRQQALGICDSIARSGEWHSGCP